MGLSWGATGRSGGQVQQVQPCAGLAGGCMSLRLVSLGSSVAYGVRPITALCPVGAHLPWLE